MEEYFLNAGVPPALHFDPSLVSVPSTWPPQSLQSSTPELNYSPEQSLDCFLKSNWEKSTDQYSQFESALSSMVSSPAASNSAISNDNIEIRELIGKLGTIFNSSEMSPPLVVGNSYVGGGKHSTPLNCPVKLPLQIVDQLTSLGSSMSLNNSPLPALSAADPSFAERAAKFSTFGSRSFNGRTGPFGLNTSELPYRSTSPLMSGGNLSRVSSSPSLNANGSLTKNNQTSHSQMEMNPINGTVSGSGRLPGSAANSNEQSSVSHEQNPVVEKGSKTPSELNSRKRKAVSRGKAKGAEVDNNANAKRSRQAEEDDPSKNDIVNAEEEKMGNCTNGVCDEGQKQGKANQKLPEPPKDYIHVRARRGQATDSHSLAERVRREKIGQRMKFLQDLVPGCNKVTGKALMLDEIINYVQSLQRQVEFLSMKLATINPKMDFKKDGHLSKDIFQQNGFCALDPLDCCLDPLDSTVCCNITMQLPLHNGFVEDLPQLQTFCEDDLQSIVHMGFRNNPSEDATFRLQRFPATNQTSHTKIDL